MSEDKHKKASEVNQKELTEQNNSPYFFEFRGKKFPVRQAFGRYHFLQSIEFFTQEIQPTEPETKQT